MNLFMNRLRVVAVAAAVCVSNVVAQGHAVGAPNVSRARDYSGTYYIVNKNGTALHTHNAGTDNLTPIVIFNGYGARDRQDTQAQWSFARQSDGTYIITNVKSGKVLDLPRGSNKIGEELIIYGRNGGTNQKWRVEQNEGNYVSFVSVSSGQAVDVPKYSTQNGTRVIQYSYHRGKEQQFRLIPVN